MLDGARKFEFPAGLLDGEPDAVLLPIPVPVVPYFRRFFAQMESPYVWKSRADFERAYPVFVEIEAQMTASLSTLTTSIDRLYRLLDTSLNGTQYSEAAGVITPELPAVPPASATATNAMRAHVGRIWHLAENSVAGETAPADAGITGAAALADDLSTRETLRAMQGIINAGWFGIGGQNATVADVVNALRIGSPAKKQSMLDLLSQILGAGSDVASIFNLIEGLLADTAEGIEEGAMIATLLASTMAQAALAGAQAAQIDRLILALDGGGITPPASNVLSELQLTNSINQSIATMIGGVGELPTSTPLLGYAHEWQTVQYPAILAALQTGNSSAALEAIAAALGTTADCVTGESVIGLLCRLNSLVGGELSPPGPPATCPGYETNPFVRVASWERYTPDGNPSSVYYGQLATPGGNMYLTTGRIDLISGNGTTSIPVFQSTVPNMSICISIAGLSADGFINIDAYNPSTGQLFMSAPIKNSVNAGQYNDTIQLNTQYVYAVSALQQYTNEETTPTSPIWIIRGGVG